MTQINDGIAKIVQIYMKNVTFDESMYERDLIALGMNSIAFIQIITAIEEKFDVEIPDEYLLSRQLNSISKMGNVVYQLIGE